MEIETRKVKWLTSAVLLWLAFAPLAQAFYNPSTGRWLSRDPLGERGGVNLHSFIGNDAVDRFDPLGLMRWSEFEKTLTELRLFFHKQKCCEKSYTLEAHLGARAIGMMVKASATYSVGGSGGKPVILGYYWWDCFTAQRERGTVGMWWDIHHGDPQEFEDYGWRGGINTISETHQGHTLPPSEDLYDSGHWNWRVRIVYLVCLFGRLEITWDESNQVEFDWNEPTKSWTAP